MAGVSRLQDSSEIRLLRVMGSGRVDLRCILRAFAAGHDGVFVGGCKLNECNYTTQGNYDALSVTAMCRRLMGAIGLNPERLSIEFMSGGDGNLLAELIDGFAGRIGEIGRLGAAEGMEPGLLKLKLEAVERLVPYLRLAERERLRVPRKSAGEYEGFFESVVFDRLFHELVSDRLAISQILLLLRERPLSTQEISDHLDLKPSEISRHMISSSRQGLVRYDTDGKRYCLA